MTQTKTTQEIMDEFNQLSYANKVIYLRKQWKPSAENLKSLDTGADNL